MSLAYLSPGAILRQAVKYGCDDVVRYLISLGVFKDSADEEGKTALYLAAEKGM